MEKHKKQKLISGDEILPDWRGLTKKEVNQQLRLYGINPSDASWFLDEKVQHTYPQNIPLVSNTEDGIENGRSQNNSGHFYSGNEFLMTHMPLNHRHLRTFTFMTSFSSLL